MESKPTTMTSVHDKDTSFAALLLSNFAEIARDEVRTTPVRIGDHNHYPIVSPELTKSNLPLEAREIPKVEEIPLNNLSNSERKNAEIPTLNSPRSSMKMTKSFTLRPRTSIKVDYLSNSSNSFKSNGLMFSTNDVNSNLSNQFSTNCNYVSNIAVVGCSPIYHSTCMRDRISESNSSIISDSPTTTLPAMDPRSLRVYNKSISTPPPYFPVSPTSLKKCGKEKLGIRVLKRKFSWKNYPELESFLVANREEYLHHSQLNYTIEQKQYNNRLTERLIRLAEESGYEFDKTEFNFVAIRDRIRCYFKSYVQSNKKKGIIIGYRATKTKSNELV
mmetsp:Transcript_41252/g.80726  ORF Transcript_41252/g.80726 Transcript_41252/m.80726 type:complete len:332 (+) Transcript_41252:76-1071(+)